MTPWTDVIVLTKGGVIEQYNTLDEICTDYPEIDIKSLKGLTFPFVYKGWDFNKVQYRTKAE